MVWPGFKPRIIFLRGDTKHLVTVVFFSCSNQQGLSPQWSPRDEEGLSCHKNNKLYLHLTSTNIYTLSLQLDECKVNVHIVCHLFMYSQTSLLLCAHKMLLSFYSIVGSDQASLPTDASQYQVNVKTAAIHICCALNAINMCSIDICRKYLLKKIKIKITHDAIHDDVWCL